ncbi:MAG: ubiquinol-cytochrome c reductase iron-sulfur subunit [Steroidobacteraceae bacterium]
MTEETHDPDRRRLLTTAVAAIGGAGAGVASVPFVQSLSPNQAAEAAGADTEVDISDLQPGQMKVVAWRNRPVMIIRRTPEMLENMRTLEGRLRDSSSQASQQPDYAKNWHRSIRPDIFVVVDVCTHLSCTPSFRPEYAITEAGPWWRGGLLCPCHNSQYDLAGRVFEGVSPAPINLPVPPHHFVSDTKIVIGDRSEHT